MDSSPEKSPDHVHEDTAEGTVYKVDDDDNKGEDMAQPLRDYVPGTTEERRLVRKIDLVLLPCLWWMYGPRQHRQRQRGGPERGPRDDGLRLASRQGGVIENHKPGRG